MRFRSRFRFAVPLVAAGLIGLGAWLPTVGASAAPDLPRATPQQVLTKVIGGRTSHLSGTVSWQANLGLPSLSGLSSPAIQGAPTVSSFRPASLLSGTSTLRVWVDGAGLNRVAIGGNFSEYDIVHRGHQAWVWDSATSHVTHYTFQAPTDQDRLSDINLSPRAASSVNPDSLGSPEGAAPADPAAVARMLLADLFTTATTVSVGPSVSVAGRSAYQLDLAPDRAVVANAGSTVGRIAFAVDARTGLVLRVTVYAAGQAKPVFQVGFTSIDYATPPASVFAPPQGRSETTKVLHPHTFHYRAATSSPVGQGPPPLGSPRLTSLVSSAGSGELLRLAAVPLASLLSSATVTGSDWGSILVAATAGPFQGFAGVAKAVSGPWGSGWLVHSTLLNALFLPDGRVLAGFVTPASLEAAAARIG